MTNPGEERPVDLLIIGGGINGVGIARDAAGRGLSVILCEQRDLATEHPERANELAEQLALQVLSSRAQHEPGQPVAPSRETAEQLEALGYLE